MRWVTRERPKIDRLACPWLISRFIDDDPEFLFVAARDVPAVAARTGAVPFDVPGVELSGSPGCCSFDAFLSKYRLADRGLIRLAAIVRAADTDDIAGAPEAAGLRAISFGLASVVRDDHALLAHALILYDGLYKWVRKLTPEAASRQPPQRGLRRWIARHRERGALAALDGRLLRDVGVTPSEARRESGKPFWKK